MPLCMPLFPSQHPQVADAQQESEPAPTIERLVESAGVSMGPIALTFGSNPCESSDASTSGMAMRAQCVVSM